MQNSLLKRGFLPQMQTMEIDEQECGYQQPRKFIKKSLEIEIPEIHADENIPPPIPSLCSQSSKFVFHALKNLQPIKGLTSTPTRYTDLPGKGLDFGNIFTDSNTKYDNYYEEEEFYSIVMEKCHRKTMEDRAICEKILDPQLKVSFFGVYDGHTNTYACDFLQKNLHRCIINHPDFITQPNLALKEAFERIDQEICRNQEKFNIQGGSTALCAMFNSQTVRIANVGDCKAVLIHNGEPITLNVEHRASNEDEKQRVESRGGFILEKKGKTTVRQMVQGSLELTRSIGDQAYKQYITCEPDILEYQLGEGDEYLLLGSDGFWNELSERQVADLITSFKSTKGLSRFLVDQALQKRNYNIDNITLIVISLQEYARFRQMIDENCVANYFLQCTKEFMF